MGEGILKRWAESSGYELVSYENCWFFKGPFFWTSSRGQNVFRVTVRDAEGSVRSGYVCCGGFWLGTLSDKAEVRWDD